MTRLSLAFVLLVCSQAHAQIDCGGDANNRLVPLAYSGVAGIWFRGDIARCLLAVAEELPRRRSEVSLLQERLQLSDDRANVLSAQVADARAESVRLQAAIDGRDVEIDALGRRLEAASQTPWYVHPVFWFCVGVGLGAAGVGALVIGVSR